MWLLVLRVDRAGEETARLGLFLLLARSDGVDPAAARQRL